MSKNIPLDIFDYELFTLRHTTASFRPEGKANVTQGRFVSFLIGGNKGNKLFDGMCQFFDSYWKNHAELVNYYLIDFALSKCVDVFQEVRQSLDKLPVSDHFWDLSEHGNEPAYRGGSLEGFSLS